MCEEVFQDNTSLLEHHGAQHVFPYGHCSASYTSKLSLEKHNLETDSIYCIICNLSFQTQSEVDNHKKNVQPSIHTLVCMYSSVKSVKRKSPLQMIRISILKSSIHLPVVYATSSCQKRQILRSTKLKYILCVQYVCVSLKQKKD